MHSLFGGEFEAELVEVVRRALVFLVGEELDDGVGDAWADFVDGLSSSAVAER